MGSNPLGEAADAGRQITPARRGVYILRGLLICGLVVTAGSGEGASHAVFRAALPLLAGLGFGTAVRGARETEPRLTRAWSVHIGATWLATLSPLMWGNREVVRTCAIAAGLVMVLRSGHRALLWSIALAICLTVAGMESIRPDQAVLGVGDLRYALGFAWPRGWTEVGRDAALFFLGCWTAGGRGVRLVARLRGAADALCAVGRMPLTIALGQGVVAWLLLRAGEPDGSSPWFRPAVVDGALTAQLIFAWWWLRDRPLGPCEHALGVVRRSLISLRLGLAKLHGGIPKEIHHADRAAGSK